MCPSSPWHPRLGGEQQQQQLDNVLVQVSWTNVYDMDSDDDRGDAGHRGNSLEQTRVKTAAPAKRTAALTAVVDYRAAPPAPDVFTLPDDVNDDDDLPGQVLLFLRLPPLYPVPSPYSVQSFPNPDLQIVLTPRAPF
jgi:hypothetical protein